MPIPFTVSRLTTPSSSTLTCPSSSLRTNTRSFIVRGTAAQNFGTLPCPFPSLHTLRARSGSVQRHALYWVSEPTTLDGEVEKKPKKPELPVADQLFLLKQGKRTVKQYIRKFCSLVSKLPTEQRNDSLLREYFIGGLNTPVQLWVFEFRPRTCREAIIDAIFFENDLYSFLAPPPHHYRHVRALYPDSDSDPVW